MHALIRFISPVRVLALALFLPVLGQAQPAPEVVASGFLWPTDLTHDARGWLWVAEGGDGTAGSGRVSIVTPDGTRHDFLTGLPSERLPFIAYGARSVHFIDGALVVVLGGGSDPLARSVVSIDTTGFSPGDAPRTAADVTVRASIGAYADGEGFASSSPTDLAVGLDGAWYITDAFAGALFRYDPATDVISTVTTFPSVPNPAPPPPSLMPDAHGIVPRGDHFLVAAPTGFPYLPDQGTLYAVWPDGTLETVQDGLDQPADVALHPADGTPVVALKGEVDAALGWLEGTSSIRRLDETPLDLGTDLTAAWALTFGPDGGLYYTGSRATDSVYRIPPAVLGADVFASGLFGSVGLAVDDSGRLWGTQPGTGNDDARIAVLDDGGQWQSFAINLPSNTGVEGPEGANHLLFDGTDLWVAVGTGSASPRGFLYRFDTAGFTPGDPPLTPTDATLTVDMAAFVLGQGFAETNVYGLAQAPDGSLYMTDASANAVFRRAPDGTLSLVADLPSIPNPTPVGPPVVQTVPTGIVFDSDRLYVAALTGFPFVQGLSRVYEVSLAGDVSIHREGLTSSVDLAADPRDGALSVLQFGQFSFEGGPPGFTPLTGLVRRIDNDEVLALNLSFSSALAYDASGDLYVATLGGDVYRVQSNAVDNEPGPVDALPDGLVLHPAYPNPFNPSTQLTFELAQAGPVRLAVYDALGRHVAVLAQGRYAAGPHTVSFDARGLPSGLYLVRLTSGEQSQTRRVTLVR